MNQVDTEKNQWILYVLPLVILSVFMIGYWPTFQKLMIRWGSGDNSYCYLIIPLFIYLCWDMRHASHAGNRLEVRGRNQKSEARNQPRRWAKAPSLIKEETLSGLVSYERSETRMPQTSSEKNLEPDAIGGFTFGEFSWSLWGLVPVFLSVLLMIFGEIGSLETILYTGFWGCVVGIIILLYGNRTRLLAFQLFILLFIVPLPPFINRILTFKLKMAASTLAVNMLRLTGASVLQQGNIIDIGVNQLQVVDACSGVRYFMPLILMAMLVGYFFVKRRWQWLVLILLVPPLTVVVNAFRIFITGVLIRSGYPELAENFFHDFSGWLVFMVAGAILVGAALVLKRIGGKVREQKTEVSSQRSEVREEKSETRRQKSAPPLGASVQFDQKRSFVRPSFIREVGSQTLEGLTKSDQATNQPFDDLTKPSAPNQHWKKPALITIFLCLLFIGSGWAVKKIPSARNLPPRISFDTFPTQIAHWQGKKRTIEDKILNELWADDYINAIFQNSKTPNAIYLLIPFYEYQGTRHTAHAPQACLLGGGWDMLKDQNHVIAIHPDKSIEIRTMHLRKGNFRMLGSYFFFQRGRVITSPWMNKLYLIWDSITKQRTDGALVRVELTLAPNQSMESAYAMLDEFIKALWPILPKYIPE
jgi:EpsI family protein